MWHRFLWNILKYYNISTVLQYLTPAVPHTKQGNRMQCELDVILQSFTMSLTQVATLST